MATSQAARQLFAALSRQVSAPFSSSKLRAVQNLVTWWFVYKAFKLWRNKGAAGLVKMALGKIVSAAKVLPGAGALLDAQIEKEIEAIKKKMLGAGDPDACFQLPATGKSPAAIMEYATDAVQAEAFSSGKKWAGIYHDSVEGPQETDPSNHLAQLEHLQVKMWTLYNNSNALYPTIFPSLRKYEAEIVSIAVSLLHGREDGRQAEGLLASGGTESILLAVLAYRELATQRGIEKPELIGCRTCHGALNKACHYFGVKLILVDADPVTQTMQVATVKQQITPNTIAVYASAPTFPHGVVDPIEGLAALLKPLKIGLHVDNCLGGFLLSSLQKIGVFKRKFDFQVDGVTSISIDIHKYGYAPKGVSVICFNDAKLRALTIHPVVEGLTLYVTPTLQGSRSGATIAAAWATLQTVGMEGYLQAAKRINEMKQKLERAVEAAEGLQLVVRSDASIVPITSDKFDIFAAASMMDAKGWNTFTSMDPPSMAICLGEQHARVLDTWIKDLLEISQFLLNNPAPKVEGDAAVYGAAKLLPANILNDVMRKYIHVKMTVKGTGN